VAAHAVTAGRSLCADTTFSTGVCAAANADHVISNNRNLRIFEMLRGPSYALLSARHLQVIKLQH